MKVEDEREKLNGEIKHLEWRVDTLKNSSADSLHKYRDEKAKYKSEVRQFKAQQVRYAGEEKADIHDALVPYKNASETYHKEEEDAEHALKAQQMRFAAE